MTTAPGNKVGNSNRKSVAHKESFSLQVSGMGIDDLIYPRLQLDADRHPYTREVVIYAQSQGINQTQIGKLCEVSQSQVSQWVEGSGKAKIEQLQPLIDKVTPVLPGKEFHIVEKIKSQTLTLPEDWEVDMITAALSSKLCQKDVNLTKASVVRLLTGEIEEDFKEQVSVIEQEFKSKAQKLNDSLRKLQHVCKQFRLDQEDYEEKIAQAVQLRTQHLEENPQLNDLSNVDSYLKSQFPEPELNAQIHDQYQLVRNDFNNQYSLELSADMSEENVREACEKVLEGFKKAKDKKRKKLEDQKRIDLRDKTILQKYSRDEGLPILSYQDDVLLDNQRAVRELARRLYGLNENVTIKGTVRSHWGGQNDFSADLNMIEIFADYVINHPSKVEAQIIQVCGELIVTQSLNDIEIKVYQLHSKKLMLSWKRSRYDYPFIKIFSSASELLEQVMDILDRPENIDNEPLYRTIKDELMAIGYRVDGVSVIY